MIIQFCGLSGSGKTTLANRLQLLLHAQGLKCEVIDGDVYRKKLCPDLGFTKADRNENIRRLAFVAGALAKHGVIPIICAINPYEEIRKEITASYEQVKTIYIDCPMDMLLQRDTKQLYRKAMLPDGHPDKINNLTGVNDPFEIPTQPDLVIKTGEETAEESAEKLLQFILSVI
ncbi:MAG: adenylyl-sulfate kinase [Bacteroidota bacterium]